MENLKIKLLIIFFTADKILGIYRGIEKINHQAITLVYTECIAAIYDFNLMLYRFYQNLNLKKMKKIFCFLFVIIGLTGCTNDGGGNDDDNNSNDNNGVFQGTIEGDANIQFKVVGGCDKVFAHYFPSDASNDYTNILLIEGFDGKQTIGITLYFKGSYPSNPVFQLGIIGGDANGLLSGWGQFIPDTFGNASTYYSTDDKHFGTCTITEYDKAKQRISGTFSFNGQLYNSSAMVSGATTTLKGSFSNVPISDLTDTLNPKGPCNNSQGSSLGGGNNTGGGLGGGTSDNGQVMFWAASDLGCGNILVTCNGISSNVTGYSATAPLCGTSTAATFTLPPGTYNYSASCSGGLSLNGTTTVTANGCNKIELVKNGGNTGGGGFLANNTVTFWVASDLGCCEITVKCNGISRTITGFYSSGAPACDATGTATFVLPTSQGTYNYTASCSGLTWSDTVTTSTNSSSNPCIKIELKK
jgi:hypothetical protein